jgi:hypothetical protein
MATIESSPLPPPGFGGPITKITEADRAAIMAQANEVIDFLLNGPGSFTVDGPRKPPIDERGFDSTVQDLNNFKASVIAAKQFADDPNHVLDSVLELIRKTGDQIQNVVRDHATTGPGIKDSIFNSPPDTIDPLNNARVPVPLPIPDVPQDPRNGVPRGQSITLQASMPPKSPGLDLPPSPDANAPVSLFTRLLSAGPDALPAADNAASPPLQPDATQDVADNSPTRFLVGRSYDPTQGPLFKVQPAPSQSSPDGSLSLNDAYLEYLKRLNA